jgi:hypothetical protein
VFIADTIRELLQRRLEDMIFVDEVEVRGRQAKVKLWSLPEGQRPSYGWYFFAMLRGVLVGLAIFVVVWLIFAWFILEPR